MHENFFITSEYFYIVNMVMGTGLGTTPLNTKRLYMPLHALLHRYMQPMVLRRRRNLPDNNGI